MFQKDRGHQFPLRAICAIGVLSASLFLGSQLITSSQPSMPYALSQSIIPTPTSPPVIMPQLALGKTVDNEEPSPGDIITYTLSYSASEAPATDVTIYDFLPAGVQLVSTDPAYDSYIDGVVVFHDEYVGSEVETIAICVRVLGGYDQLYNHAVVSAECVTPTHASLLIDIVLPSEPTTSTLRLTKTGTPLVFVGGEVVYTLRCENIGYTTVADVQVIDVLPTGSGLMETSPPADAVTSPTVQWSVGDLGPGEVWESVITVTAPSYAGIVTNTAFADASSTVMTQTLFATRVVTAAGVLQVSKEAYPEEVPVGSEIVYMISYSNDGNRVATGVILTDTFPADIVVTGYDPTPTSITPERGIWELGSLEPGESGQITITATVIGEPNRLLHNTVHIAGDELTFPAYAELLTPVREWMRYLPLVLRE
ncbi:MAG: DUF11 domain-containing protein [Anaerolineae bacterium]|nr:DUF11 domain-containing protein [Anaerolineae bacterium]